MPSGKVHALTTTLVAGLSAPLLVLAAGQIPAHAAAFAAGCLFGLVVTPDLDVDHGTKSETIVRDTAGCLGVTVWQLFWWPYAWLIPHRSPLSHWPILGTLSRLAYLFLVPLLLWWFAGHWIDLPSLTLPKLTPLWLWGIAGLMVVDTFHSIQDRL